MIKVRDMRVLEHILMALNAHREQAVTEGFLWEKELNGKARHALTNAINHHRQTYHQRVPAESVCAMCQQPCRDHPFDGPLGCGGVPYLRRLCTGDLVLVLPPGPPRFLEQHRSCECPGMAVTRLRAQVEAAGLKWDKAGVRLLASGVEWMEGRS